MKTPSVRHLAGFLCLISWLISNNYCRAQQPDSSRSRYAAFDELMQKLPQKRHGNTLLQPPVIFRDSTYNQPRTLEYELRLSEHPLNLQKQTVRLHNPKSGGDRPVCYSVVYQNCLVALFTTGNFGCFRLTDFGRDTLLEAQLNTFAFERHWLLSQQLIGWREGQAFYFDAIQHVWRVYKQPLPFEGRLKVFEDERFVCTMDCHGEFGGHIYFFDKQTQRTHYANATCATTVQKINGQYHLLASLAHMQGSAHSALIAAPEKLPVVTKKLDPARDWQYHFADSKPNKAVKSVFNYHGLTMAGSFQWYEQIFYIVDWYPITFLASISGKTITIVDPLFNKHLSPSKTIATAFAPNSVLISYSHYEARKSTEGRCLLFQDRRVTEIVWSDQPER